MSLKSELKLSKDIENIYEKSFVNLMYTAKWLENHNVSTFKKEGINGQHYNILRILRGQSPKSLCPKDILEVMVDKTRDLTRLVDKLVKMGYVNRQVNPTNRRQVNINITKEGLDFLIKIDPELRKLDDLLKHIDKEDLNVLNTILDRIRNNQNN